MNDSAKATNSEIVKSLVVLVQDYYDSSHRGAQEVNPECLVHCVSQVLNTHRRQRDRLADLMDGMKRIVEGG